MVDPTVEYNDIVIPTTSLGIVCHCIGGQLVRGVILWHHSKGWA